VLLTFINTKIQKCTNFVLTLDSLSSPKMANLANQAYPTTDNAAVFGLQQRQQQRGGDQQEQAGYRGYKSRNQNPYHSNHLGPRWNNSRNGKFCNFCQIMGHTQQECWKRIKENKPCIDMNGHPFWPKGNFNNRQEMQNRGSNASRNGKFCIYCKILNHTQQECRKRIRDNNPCIDNKGQLFWPKINSTLKATNSVTAITNSDPNNEVGSVFQ